MLRCLFSHLKNWEYNVIFSEQCLVINSQNKNVGFFVLCCSSLQLLAAFSFTDFYGILLNMFQSCCVSVFQNLALEYFIVISLLYLFFFFPRYFQWLKLNASQFLYAYSVGLYFLCAVLGNHMGLFDLPLHPSELKKTKLSPNGIWSHALDPQKNPIQDDDIVLARLRSVLCSYHVLLCPGDPYALEKLPQICATQ